MKPPLKPETGIDTHREGPDWRVVGTKKGKKVFDEVVELGEVHDTETKAWGAVKGPKQPLGRK